MEGPAGAEGPGRFARPGEPAAAPDPTVSADELLERVEAQAEELSQARERIGRLERGLKAQAQFRQRLVADLLEERDISAGLERDLHRSEAKLQTARMVDREMERLQGAVRALESELQSTRMQLDAVRGELASRGRLGQRLRPRSWR